jgi:hypothetical protein
LGSGFYALFDPGIAPAPAKDIIHFPDNLIGTGHGLLGQRSGHLHDHPGLAVSALGNLLFDPGLLDRMILGQTFNGHDLFAFDFTDGNRARANGLPVDMDRTGPAFSYTAAILGPFEIEVVPEYPKQRGVWGGVHLIGLTVHIQRNHILLLIDDLISERILN